MPVLVTVSLSTLFTLPSGCVASLSLLESIQLGGFGISIHKKSITIFWIKAIIEFWYKFFEIRRFSSIYQIQKFTSG